MVRGWACTKCFPKEGAHIKALFLVVSLLSLSFVPPSLRSLHLWCGEKCSHIPAKPTNYNPLAAYPLPHRSRSVALRGGTQRGRNRPVPFPLGPPPQSNGPVLCL